MFKHRKSKTGSISLESAIVMPVVFVIVFLLIFIAFFYLEQMYFYYNLMRVKNELQEETFENEYTINDINIMLEEKLNKSVIMNSIKDCNIHITKKTENGVNLYEINVMKELEMPIISSFKDRFIIKYKTEIIRDSPLYGDVNEK